MHQICFVDIEKELAFNWTGAQLVTYINGNEIVYVQFEGFRQLIRGQ